MGPGVLEKILKDLPKFSDDNLLVGIESSDDAAVYKINDDLAMIQTVDFFPPVVDDPYTFGQIAAVNALSDVYAMGGTPRLAMNLICFSSCMELETVKAILEGGYSKVAEAGAIIAGGHTIEDSEPKYGLCVTGYVHPSRVLANNTARPGDVLVLTKPIGTGILSLADRAGMLGSETSALMIRLMTDLNNRARDAIVCFNVSACTDVTGFGLLGHVYEMAKGSGNTVEIFAGSVPVIPQSLELARNGIIPAGAYQNMDYIGKLVKVEGNIMRERIDCMYDPQTSGGLLAAVPESESARLVGRLRETSGFAEIIGQVIPFSGNYITVRE